MISKTAAKRQAHSESRMYRQGRGWIVVTYDPHVNTTRTDNEVPYWLARQVLSDWRMRRVVQLMADSTNDVNTTPEIS